MWIQKPWFERPLQSVCGLKYYHAKTLMIASNERRFIPKRYYDNDDSDGKENKMKMDVADQIF